MWPIRGVVFHENTSSKFKSKGAEIVLGTPNFIAQLRLCFLFRMSEAELFQSLLRSATNYGSLSEYFIDNIVTKSDNFDFSMDQVFQLCDAEPQHCEDVFLALEHSVSSELQSSNQILDPIGKKVRELQRRFFEDFG